MSFGRRPPPPPPMDDFEPVPPVLPPRHGPQVNKMESSNSALSSQTKKISVPSPKSTQMAMPLLDGENVQSNQQKKSVRAWDSFKELGHQISNSLPMGKSASFGRVRKTSAPPSSCSNSEQSKAVKIKEQHQRDAVGDSPPMEDTDDTYEQPSPQSSSEFISAKAGDITSFSSFQREASADKSDSDGWSDSEWEDTPHGDLPSSSPSDDTYLMPDGGNVSDDYQLPDDDTHAASMKTIKPPVTSRVHPDSPKPPTPFPNSNVSTKSITNGSKTDIISTFGVKLTPAINKPIPPPNKPSVEQNKPLPKPKPFSSVPDQDFPKLPPRHKDKVLPSLPLVEPKMDSFSDDNTSAGSVSSDLESKVHQNITSLHQNKKGMVQVLPTAVHEDIKLKSTAVRVMAVKSDTRSNQRVITPKNYTEAPIYDDGASEVLSQFDWYHGELDRDEGARRVKQLSENGTFLIRASKADGTDNSHPHTLVVTLDHKVYNMKIRLRGDNRFAIGNYKSDEVSFSTVPELVEHHKENYIKLAEGGAVKLTRTPKK